MKAALFETNQKSSVESEAKWDYYTISAKGFTFYPKNDPLNGTFHSTADWEMHRRHFEAIASKPTFELYDSIIRTCTFLLLLSTTSPFVACGQRNRFRYRKVFLAWKKWIRTSKMETARVNLMLEGYFSHISLSNAINEVRAQLRRLEECQLEWDFRGRSLKLTQFTAANVSRV